MKHSYTHMKVSTGGDRANYIDFHITKLGVYGDIAKTFGILLRNEVIQDFWIEKLNGEEVSYKVSFGTPDAGKTYDARIWLNDYDAKIAKQLGDAIQEYLDKKYEEIHEFKRKYKAVQELEDK